MNIIFHNIFNKFTLKNAPICHYYCGNSERMTIFAQRLDAVYLRNKRYTVRRSADAAAFIS